MKEREVVIDGVRLKLRWVPVIVPPGEDEEPEGGYWEVISVGEPWLRSKSMARYRAFLEVMRGLRRAGIELPPECGDFENVVPEDWGIWLEEVVEPVIGSETVNAIFQAVRDRVEMRRLEIEGLRTGYVEVYRVRR